MSSHVSQPRTGSAMPLTARHVVVHTDGGCIGNPGPGGYAAVLRMWIDGEMVKRTAITGREGDTTNICVAVLEGPGVVADMRAEIEALTGQPAVH